MESIPSGIMKELCDTAGLSQSRLSHPRLFHEEFELLSNARSLTLRLFSEQDNAGGHCNVGNSKKVLDAMISWLREA